MCLRKKYCQIISVFCLFIIIFKCAIFSTIMSGRTVKRGSGIAGRCITDVLHSISYHQPQTNEPRRLNKDIKPLLAL